MPHPGGDLDRLPVQVGGLGVHDDGDVGFQQATGRAGDGAPLCAEGDLRLVGTGIASPTAAPAWSNGSGSAVAPSTGTSPTCGSSVCWPGPSTAAAPTHAAPQACWAGTATIYAATAPPAWDHAMGHRIRGRGYTARLIGYTCEGRERAIADARAAAARRRRDTPSCRQNTRRQKAKVGGKEKNTAARRQRAARATSCTPHQAAHGVDVAAWVRPRVSWTQREQLRRLAFALRPLIVAGMSREAIVAELHSWWLTWRPHSPAAYITARLRTAALTARLSPPEEAPAPVQGVPANAAFRQARAQLHDDWPLSRSTDADGLSVPDEPAHLIRSRILASLA